MEFGILIFRLEDGSIQQKVLRAGANAIGRDAANDVVLPASAVSRFHARLICSAAGCRIIDRESANGTRVNGERLEPNVDRALKHGDTIEIGPYQIRYVQPRRPAAPPPQGSALPPKITVATWSSDGAPQPVRLLRQAGERSDYFRFLPGFYEAEDTDGLLNALLCIAETILVPLDRQIAQLDCYIDPQVAPVAMLPWLAFWVDLVLNENWPIERRRELITRAAQLYRWRGTRKGLRDYLEAYTGIVPIIVEPKQETVQNNLAFRKEVLDTLKLKDLGQIPTALLQRIEQPLPNATFRVLLVVPDKSPINEMLLRQIIEAEKPAHTAYELVLWPA